MQINAGKSPLAVTEIINISIAHKIDIITIQEVPIIANKIAGCPIRYKQHLTSYTSSKPAKNFASAGIIILNSNLYTSAYVTQRHHITTTLKIFDEITYLTSCYLPPNQHFEQALAELTSTHAKVNNNTNRWIISGDLNSRSMEWGNTVTTTRGKQLTGALLTLKGIVTGSMRTPTFERVRRGKYERSIIDLVILHENSPLNVVNEETLLFSSCLSDHNPIIYELTSKNGKPATTTSELTRQYNTSKADWSKFRSKLLDSYSTTETISGEILHHYAVEACSETLKPSETRAKKLVWWTEDLSNLSRKVQSSRRSMFSTRNPQFLAERITRYKKLKVEFRVQLEQTKSSYWKNFCESLKRADTWSSLHRIAKSTNGVHCQTLQDTTGCLLTAKESAEIIADHFFPSDDDSSENAPHKLIRDKLLANYKSPTEEPQFNQSELREIFTSVSKKKAPGYEGLTSDICEQIRLASPAVLARAYNHCLETGNFPKVWKKAVIKIIPKPNKSDYRQPSSYRPIGLLPLLGKGLEKLIFTRLYWHLEKRHPLSENQYGFRCNRSAEEALLNITDILRKILTMKQYAILTSLDIKGAFDNAWWPMILYQLRKRNVSESIYGLIKSYLSERTVEVRYMGETSNRGTNKGCIQGSVLGPLFWSLIIDPILRLRLPSNCHIMAYADDITIVVSDANPELAIKQTQRILNKVMNWSKENKLELCPEKCVTMMVTKKLRRPQIKLQVNGNWLREVNSIRILGKVYDKNLTHRGHLKHTIQKAWCYAGRALSVSRRMYALNTEIYLLILQAVIKPILEYGLVASENLNQRVYYKKAINKIERCWLVRATKSHFTTSLNTLHLVCGITSLNAEIQRAVEVKRINLTLDPSPYVDTSTVIQQKVGINTLIHPSRYGDVAVLLRQRFTATSFDVFTDGSKSEEGVGCGFVVYYAGQVFQKSYKLENFCSISQAELLAIQKALLFIINMLRTGNGVSRATIWSDSMSSLMMIKSSRSRNKTVYRIQKQCSALRDKGVKTSICWVKAHAGIDGNERADCIAKQAAASQQPIDFRLFPFSKIKYESKIVMLEQFKQAAKLTYEKKERLLRIDEISKNLIASNAKESIYFFLTGHGPFLDHLHMLGQAITSQCPCGQTKQTSLHVAKSCPIFSPERRELCQKLCIDGIWEKELLKSVENIFYAEKIMKKMVRKLHLVNSPYLITTVSVRPLFVGQRTSIHDIHDNADVNVRAVA